MEDTDYHSYHDHNDGDDVDIEDDDAHAVPETHPLQPPGCSVTFLARPTQSITRKLFSNVNHRNVSKSQYWSHICRAVLLKVAEDFYSITTFVTIFKQVYSTVNFFSTSFFIIYEDTLTSLEEFFVTHSLTHWRNNSSFYLSFVSLKVNPS